MFGQEWTLAATNQRLMVIQWEFNGMYKGYQTQREKSNGLKNGDNLITWGEWPTHQFNRGNEWCFRKKHDSLDSQELPNECHIESKTDGTSTVSSSPVRPICFFPRNLLADDVLWSNIWHVFVGLFHHHAGYIPKKILLQLIGKSFGHSLSPPESSCCSWNCWQILNI